MTCHKKHLGFTLIELIIAISISSILVLTAGILLVNGQKTWQKTYDLVNKKIRQDSQVITIVFGNVGRKANRVNYTIYKKENNKFVPATVQTANPEEIVSGQALEMRYWDVDIDKTDSHNLLDNTKTATAYAFFYIDNNCLMLDYGPYPPGAVSASGVKNLYNINTVALSENVSQQNIENTFSHTAINGIGQGCVRINLTLLDTDTNETINIKTATMPRNIWPK